MADCDAKPQDHAQPCVGRLQMQMGPESTASTAYVVHSHTIGRGACSCLPLLCIPGRWPCLGQVEPRGEESARDARHRCDADRKMATEEHDEAFNENLGMQVCQMYMGGREYEREPTNCLV